uniref:CD248 molecule, endosialin a n=1 Tax=Astyanax mexicanus TaxID=7994 RepID=A0A8B9GLZ9_ASTMX
PFKRGKERERETVARRMGSPVLSGATLLSVLLYLFSVSSQELRDRDALCTKDSCLVFYRERKIFLDAWRFCKHQGGNLVSVKSQEEANLLVTLFSNMELREDQRVRAWIGLQRQPRKCNPSRPMRGFSWITGEQDNQYTNWEQEDSPSTCSVPRCVSVSYSPAPQEHSNNLKWRDGPCSIPLDSYLCKYAFPGMCQGIRSEGGGNTLYTTPFDLVTSFLTHIPFGSIATVPCPTKDDQAVLCTRREDNIVGWNRDPPFCSDEPVTSWCHEDKGGCHHHCVEDGEHYYCSCNEGFVLAQDGVSCVQIDPCQGSPCEFECLAVMDSYRCACPEGYMLAPDERGCLDVNECLQSPCEHICINAPGTFECSCHEGYQADEEGNCKDVDECVDSPCEQGCENILGSYICYCQFGFSLLPEDPSRCQDVDECQIEGTCEQMCINYNGGFDCYCKEGYSLSGKRNSCVHLPDSMYEPQGTGYPWSQDPDSDYDTETEPESLDWLTEPPNMETVPTGLWLVSNAQQEESEMTPSTENESTTASIKEQDEDEILEDDSNSNPSVIQSEYESTTYKTREEGSNSEKAEGSSWLLIGLLVPLCIFIVVMIVLGVIYFTRCTAKPQNKNATDCYHWIAGAGDKAAKGNPNCTGWF